MEFPELGVHCAEPTCSRLDFLPFTCDACSKVFCLDHKTYDQHNCQESYLKDARVPVCPLCNNPVPVGRGEDPNRKVDQHIHNDCKSDAAAKLYVNRCSYKGCKKKELVQVNCNTCRKKFCLKHRFETDHNCEGVPNRSGKKSAGSSHKPPQSTTLSAIGAELNRNRLQRQQQQKPPQPQRLHQAQSGMSEDKALATAIAASLEDPPRSGNQSSSPPPPPANQVEEDEALAQAIAASLRQTDNKTRSAEQRDRSNETCSIA